MSEASQSDILKAAQEAAARLHVVAGNPDEVEVAALVAGLAAVVSHHVTHEGEHPEAISAWTNRAHQRQVSPHAGAGAHEPVDGAGRIGKYTDKATFHSSRTHQPRHTVTDRSGR